MDQRTSASTSAVRTARPALTLDQLEPADTIRIDGETYRLAVLASFALRRQARCRRIWTRMDELEKLEEPTEDDEREYRRLALEVARFALPDAPDEILAKLDNEQLGDLVVAFFARGALRSRRLQLLRETLTSAASSPGSSGSTAATPSDGST